MGIPELIVASVCRCQIGHVGLMMSNIAGADPDASEDLGAVVSLDSCTSGFALAPPDVPAGLMWLRAVRSPIRRRRFGRGATLNLPQGRWAGGRYRRCARGCRRAAAPFPHRVSVSPDKWQEGVSLIHRWSTDTVVDALRWRPRRARRVNPDALVASRRRQPLRAYTVLCP